MTTQTSVLLWTTIACLGLGVFTILAIPSVNRAFRGLFTRKQVPASRSERTPDPPTVRR